MINLLKAVIRVLLKFARWFILTLSESCLFFESRFKNTRFRNLLLRLLGHKIGFPTIVDKNIEIDGKLAVGNYVLIREGCIIGANTIIEDFCTLSRDVMIITAGHDPEDMSYRSAPVILKRFSWVGARSIILPGVTIGEHSVVAAGSVVTKNVDSGWLVGGIPARPIRKLDRSAIIHSTFGLIDVAKSALVHTMK